MLKKPETKVFDVFQNGLDVLLPLDLIRICFSYHFHLELLGEYEIPQHIQGELKCFHEIKKGNLCLHFTRPLEQSSAYPAYGLSVNCQPFCMYPRLCSTGRDYSRKYLKDLEHVCSFWDALRCQYEIYHKNPLHNSLVRLEGSLDDLGRVYSQENEHVYWTMRDRCLNNFSVFHYDVKSNQTNRIGQHNNEFNLSKHTEVVFFQNSYLITHQKYFSWYDNRTGKEIHRQVHSRKSKNVKLFVIFLNQKLYVCRGHKMMIYKIDDLI